MLIRELTEPPLRQLTEGPGYVYLGKLGRHPSRKHSLDKSMEARKSLGFEKKCCILSTVAGVKDPQC